MNFKTMLASLCILLGTSAYAQEWVTRNYEFKPGKAETVSNPAWWQISVECTITTPDDQNLLQGFMKKKSGSVNGRILNQGEHIDILVKNNDVMYIVSESGAQIEITNTGKSLVKAKCTT